jgi:allantoin racemase
MMKHVRVVTPITTKGFRDLSEFKALEGPELTVSHSEIDLGPASIECEYDEREGAQAVVIDCMGDPGMKAGRECVNIPVIGPCESAMHVASMLGHSFSFVTVLARLRPMIEHLAEQYGVPGKMASVRSVDIPVLELEQDMDRTKAALAEVAVRAVEEDGAHAIVFGCTGMLGCADAVRAGLLAKGYDVPVIDPVPLAVRLAASLIESGLSHSKLTYEQPPLKPVAGYDMPPLSVASEAAE